MSDFDPSPDSRAREADLSAELELRIPEMDCPSCAATVRASVERLEGVTRLETHVTSGRLLVEYDPSVADEAAIRSRVRAAGYGIADGDRGDRSELTLSVPEMDCASCASSVEGAVARLDGVDAVETQPASGRVTVSGAALDGDDLVAAIGDAGYEATPIDDETGALPEPRAVFRSRRGAATAVGAALVTVGMLLAFVVPAADSTLATLFGRGVGLSEALFVAAAALAGAPILRNGYYSARTRNLDIQVLMSVGIVAAVAAGHPFEGAMLAVLFGVAELLERFSMDRARDSLRELLALSPETATVRRDDGEETVPVEALAVGDVVVVRPGEKIPADGVVREGHSAVDQSPITGESVPVDREAGEAVYAGTIAESGYLEVEVRSEPGESTIDRIVELVEDAEREPTEREQFVDRFATVYTPAVVALAIAVAVGPPLLAGASWNTWFLRGLTVLVIACPCALVISTPVTVVSGITSAARNGVLIKGGRHLEAVGESDVLAVDKTGTLTTGDLSVTDVVALEGADEETVLERAGAIERRSEHPVGRAIVDAAADRGLESDAEVAGFEALPGRGVRAEVDGVTHYVGKPDLFEGVADLEHVHATDGGAVPGVGDPIPGTDGAALDADAAALDGEGADSTVDCDREGCLDVLAEVVPKLEAEGKTAVVVGTEERPLGVIGVADRVRPEARWTVSRLQEQDVRVVMLTGDNEGTARAIADAVGIEEYHAELLPDEKLEWIRRLEGRAEDSTDEDDRSTGEADYSTDEGGRPVSVAMVGDGVNDGPALATATVGIAMGAAGTDTAIETADVALMGDDLSRLPYLYRLSRKANGVIRQNVWSSLAVKALLAAGAPFGIVTVIHAVIIGDMGMSLGVTSNAMRLARETPERPDLDGE